jgi:carbon-monoxide dehydrogenase medium subunit
VTEDERVVRIGALARHHQLETSPVIAAHLPVLTEAMTHVAHLAIRNRGTIGGSLSHADPAAELPMLALLLEAELRIVSAAGIRIVAARDFFLDALSVDLAEDEMVTEIVLPKLPPQTGGVLRKSPRRSGDFALAAVAATLTLTDGAIAQARVAMTGVCRPRGACRRRALLTGMKLDKGVDDAGDRGVRAAAEPPTDCTRRPNYRRHLVACGGQGARRRLGARRMSTRGHHR